MGKRDMKKELFSVQSYADYKGKSRTTIYKWIRQKKVESVREYGGKLMVRDYVPKGKDDG